MYVEIVDINKINDGLDHIKIREDMKNLQYQLNLRIGQDLKDPKNHTTYWLFNFLQALSDEIVEAKDCINWKWWSKEGKEHGPYTTFLDIDNLKIEIIDALHFILCLELITDYKTKDRFENYILMNDNDNVWHTFIYLEGILTSIQNLKGYCGFESVFMKDLNNESLSSFKSGHPINRELKGYIHAFIDHTWNIFYSICASYLALSLEDIYKIYLLKNEANFKRQDNNYAVLTKTEEDNNLIKQKIHKD